MSAFLCSHFDTTTDFYDKIDLLASSADVDGVLSDVQWFLHQNRKPTAMRMMSLNVLQRELIKHYFSSLVFINRVRDGYDWREDG